MPEYLSPGVYVEEIDSGPKPIAPVATSDMGVCGVAAMGPTTPTLLTSYGDFLRTFGGPIAFPDEATQAVWADRGHWWHAAESVEGAFNEGAGRMYFQRVVPSGAVASSQAFNAGFSAGLAGDIDVASTTVRLTHTIDVAAGNSLTIVGADGSDLGTIDVTAVEHSTRTITFTFGGGVTFSASKDVDVARITAVDAARLIATATASSAGAWGDALSVRISPVVGARLDLGATPASGSPVASSTTALAAAGATDVDVTAVAGTLDAANAVGLTVQLNGSVTTTVTAAVDAVPDVTLTLADPLANDLPSGSDVRVLRTAMTGAVATISGAGRLYENAVVQLEGAAGAELATVVSVVGSQVTFDAAPANAYLEGEAVSLVEAEVSVRYRPVNGNEEIERIAGLRLTNDGAPTSFVAGVNARSRFIRMTADANYAATDLTAFPTAAGSPWVPLVNGDDGLATLGIGDFVGVNLGPGSRTGIQALEDIDQVAICVVPGMWSVDVRNALIVHCETLGDRFAILDPPPNLSIQEIEAFRSPIDTKYAALYYPWVEIRNPRPEGGAQLCPPSGFMGGIYARTDVARGVHKAPANETIRSIRRIAQSITKREQDVLNPQNINVLRAFPGRGNRVWGARCVTSDSAWKYINVRRLFLMIEESIDEGTQWVVFEPNDERTWARVRQSVTLFLKTQWRIGALQGASEAEAFYVVCDRSTMTQDDIDNGRLICEIGIAPVKPAEFVIFRIQQKTLELTPA